ncbi:uncharacterized protein LOC135811788 [Sycon ciliatum]|uniref:uncharacterized protein LOC135811788 n=1 Tax=Sycon ciliatum TaxID=27933 RepID=UPI0031F5F8D1
MASRAGIMAALLAACIVLAFCSKPAAGAERKGRAKLAGEHSDILAASSAAELSRGKRSLLEFARMIDCEIPNVNFVQGAVRYINYGCWCGVGGKGRTVDKIDECCKAHDECYNRAIAARCENPKFYTYKHSCSGGRVQCAPQEERGRKKRSFLRRLSRTARRVTSRISRTARRVTSRLSRTARRVTRHVSNIYRTYINPSKTNTACEHMMCRCDQVAVQCWRRYNYLYNSRNIKYFNRFDGC